MQSKQSIPKNIAQSAINVKIQYYTLNTCTNRISRHFTLECMYLVIQHSNKMLSSHQES